MGTPEFAVPTLAALHRSRHDLRLVVTQPDRPSGRGRKMTAPPVKEAARRLGLSVLQPGSIHDEDFCGHLKALNADVFITIAFGRLLPPALLNLPRCGAVNLHASLLPKYRGPAPIQWALINGETQTGMTAMRMGTGMDTGDILAASAIPIHEKDTAGSLHDRLSQTAAVLALDTLEGLARGTLAPKPQASENATYAPLLKKKDGHIDWKQPADQIERLVRGMNPWPGTFTFCGGRRLKIYQVTPIVLQTDRPPGTVLRSYPGELRVAAGRDAVLIDEIQGASGRCLCARDFLCGCDLPPGTVLT